MVVSQAIPNEHHVARYCSGSKHDDGVVLPTAFELRKDESHLSVNWLEYFGFDTFDESLARICTDIRGVINIRKTGRFAILNAGTVRSVSKDLSNLPEIKHPLTVIHMPEADNESHSGIGGLPHDHLGLLVAALLANISMLSRTFGSLIQGAIRYMRRLYSERQAGQTPDEQFANQMELILDDTMERLQRGKINEKWWKNILNQLQQSYISPDFLLELDLKKWFNEDGVADDLKELAKERIKGGHEDDPVILRRLAQSYTERTGEASNIATKIIDVVVAILSAGYIASIPPEQRALVGV